MNILYVLIPLGVVLMALAVWGFMWAVRSGQFDDMEGPAHRILMDDDDPRIPRRRRERERDDSDAD
ncbi:cbb3-type cytochrome oxidase assembly protein CcoS [Ectothiorhodospiraceae bacterium 2226]|nr:cbb3-type cytochrome oxidase assembly protein CcoS [Ectothiorhodospiraceae bacterium 2226]